GYPDGGDFKVFWPADAHIIGKDIAWFHCCIWPALLMSAGIEPPKKVLIHGYITINGEKISKSLGNVIDPRELVKKYGKETVRYFMLREIPTTEDGDFSEKLLIERHNKELADDLGNLVNRVLVLAEKKCSGRVPEVSYKHLADTALLTAKSVEEHINNYQFHLAINEILKLIGEANKLINEKKPWELEKEEAHEILYCLLECLRFLSILLYPFIPETSEKIINQLNLEKDHIDFRRLEWGNLKPGAPIKRGGLLFKKIEAK
ncbi:MAG TPA: methionine--tRNA ligase, partial [archaeon]|nr:methionine--tRNA ligase [archaeon]